jgi:dihydropteroate synthase
LGQGVTINVGGQLHDLSDPKIMGILNITPDSFYAGSRLPDIEQTLQRADQMVKEGAWCLDVGGYSSRPGATDIPEEEEIERVVSPIKELRKTYPELIISIDTFRSAVAEEAIKAGANIVNDISGGQLDSKIIDMVAEANVPYIAMHMRGTPQNMKSLTHYDDLIGEMIKYFSTIRSVAYKKGISDLILDPGFGFAKTREHNFEILQNMEAFRVLDCPMLIGVSRKSMIFKTLEIAPDEALNGTTVLNTVALLRGANILRVHDVKPAIEAIKLTHNLIKN